MLLRPYTEVHVTHVGKKLPTHPMKKKSVKVFANTVYNIANIKELEISYTEFTAKCFAGKHMNVFITPLKTVQSRTPPGFFGLSPWDIEKKSYVQSYIRVYLYQMGLKSELFRKL